MNVFIIKYCILVGAILTTVAVFGTGAFTQPSPVDETSANIDADSIFAFGSQVFYREAGQPGNEYVQAGVEGYSRNLVPNETEKSTYAVAWKAGVAAFREGYTNSTQGLYDLAMVPSLKTREAKMAACDRFRSGTAEMKRSEAYFLLAKSAASPATSSGFTIGMVLERFDRIVSHSENAEDSCTSAVFANLDGKPDAFSQDLKDAKTEVREMERIYPELKVLSEDFT